MVIATILLSSVLFHAGLERPYLTIAQGIEESKLNPKAVGRKGELGAWQVREKYWGKVPKDLSGQARHAEQILNKIMRRNKCTIKEALVRYNGSGRAASAYADRVIYRAHLLALNTH